MLSKEVKKNLEKQQYGLVGEHSACKICTWTKKSILGKGECYKAKFYGIKSHLCCQVTPTLACTNKCIFCWRNQDTPYVKQWDKSWKIDDLNKMVESLVKQHNKLLVGFYGNENADKKKLDEAKEPKHFAISLAGEPAMFPKLKELIDILHKKGKSTFVVTNGMFPEMVEKIEPTQLYVSIDAPNKELFMKIDKPIYKDAWQRFNNTLDVLAKKKCRTAVRITLIKGRNIEDIEGYAALVKKSDADFVEVKAYMFVGSSRERLEMENMPLHNEVREFAENLEKHLNGWKIVDEQEESRVVLLAKSKDTKIKF